MLATLCWSNSLQQDKDFPNLHLPGRKAVASRMWNPRPGLPKCHHHTSTGYFRTATIGFDLVNEMNGSNFDWQSSTRRVDERRSCNVRCRIETVFGMAGCTLLNISPSGAGIKADAIVLLGHGQQIAFADGPLAGVSGVVRWASHPRYGITFDKRHKNAPAVMACFASAEAKA